MTATYNVRASNNATFRWTRDFSQIATVYDLSTAVIRLQARTSPYAPDPPALELNSDGSNGAAGVVIYDPVTHLAVFAAAETAVAAMRTQLAYDCRLELPGGESVLLFSGRILWLAGVTRAPTDAASQTGVSGIGDTVTVDGETATSPTPVPLSLATALAAAQAARDSAAANAASLTPASFFAAFAALPPTQQMAFAQALWAAIITNAPTAAGTSPALWNDGGIPVYS